MNLIKDFMTTDHRSCDDFLINFESAVSNEDWVGAEAAWSHFLKDMSNHLSFEEEELFPAFEKVTGMLQGPTTVMCNEHKQMKDLLKELSQALLEKNVNRLLGLSDTLMMLIQQHNLKEEQMLYVMCDKYLSANVDELFRKFKKNI